MKTNGIVYFKQKKIGVKFFFKKKSTHAQVLKKSIDCLVSSMFLPMLQPDEKMICQDSSSYRLLHHRQSCWSPNSIESEWVFAPFDERNQSNLNSLNHSRNWDSVASAAGGAKPTSEKFKLLNCSLPDRAWPTTTRKASPLRVTPLVFRFEMTWLLPIHCNRIW